MELHTPTTQGLRRNRSKSCMLYMKSSMARALGSAIQGFVAVKFLFVVLS
jgi:hypothetical protein